MIFIIDIGKYMYKELSETSAAIHLIHNYIVIIHYGRMILESTPISETNEL